MSTAIPGYVSDSSFDENDVNIDGIDPHRYTPWSPPWARALRDALLAARIDRMPMYLLRDYRVDFWGSVWGLRGWGARPGSRPVDFFLDHVGSVWSVFPSSPDLMVAEGGRVTLGSLGLPDLSFPAEHTAFLLRGVRPFRADRSGDPSASPDRFVTVGASVLSALKGPRRRSGGMLIGREPH